MVERNWNVALATIIHPFFKCVNKFLRTDSAVDEEHLCVVAARSRDRCLKKT